MTTCSWKRLAPPSVDLLENGDFQTWDYGWTKTNASFVTNQSANATGNSAYAMHVTGNLTANSCATQTVQRNELGKTYVLSGWAKANAVPDNVARATRKPRTPTSSLACAAMDSSTA